MRDHRALETVRRKMSGVVGEWGNLAPVPDAVSVSWGVCEGLAELLREMGGDAAAALSIIDKAIAQLEALDAGAAQAAARPRFTPAPRRA
jgi:hypothetical protein